MSLDMFSLKGKVAFVTGANTGLGQGMAVGLAEAGADIVGLSRSDDSETKKLVEAEGVKYASVKADLLEESSMEKLVKEAVSAFGRLDILVNNAGIIRREDSINFSEKDWDDVMNVNLKSLFFLCQAAGNQFMAQGGGGKIINVASLLSYQGGIRVPAYTASKHGVQGITRILACEWASKGININAIAPGYMETNNTVALREDKDRFNAILGRIPAGRWGLPEDMKGAAIFLASSASDYMNGHTVDVDGGWMAR